MKLPTNMPDRESSFILRWLHLAPTMCVEAGGFVAVLVIALGCTPTVKYLGQPNKQYGSVRESRLLELRTLQSKALTDPIRACDKTLPAALNSGRFGTGWTGKPIDNQASTSWDELAMLRQMRANSCECKRYIIQASYAEPASIQTLAKMSLTDLVAISASLNQSPAVHAATRKLLMERLPTAGANDIATLYAGDWLERDDSNGRTVEPELKYKANTVCCRDSNDHTCHEVPDDAAGNGWVVGKMIKERRKALAREESSRIARERQVAYEQKRAVEEAAKQQTPTYWSEKLEWQLRRLAARFDRLDSLTRGGYAIRAQDEAWPEVQEAMRELCSTVTTMRGKAPDVEEEAVNVMVKRIAYAEGDKAAGDTRHILGNYLKGNCNETMPWLHRRP